MFDEQKRFIMEEYQESPAFSSFLPGIAGPDGIPAWCYYNNRGQAVCSFGAQDKDHAILEFCPAHVAYQNNSRTGFRTFCRVNGAWRELFVKHCRMHIGMSELEIDCRDGELSSSALYFGVPGERAAMLARVLTVKNDGSRPVDLELLDGLPAVVPYGVNQDSLKNMTQLAKAWMQAEDIEAGLAAFKVRASMEDTACVTEVKGANFALGWRADGQRLTPLVQPSLIFGEDTSLAVPKHFVEKGLEALCQVKQVTQNCFPCSFMPVRATLEPGQETVIFSLYGQVEDKKLVSRVARRVEGADGKTNEVPNWFQEKRSQAAALVEALCDRVAVKTADPVFDAYCRQTYLDNLLRGGTPVFFRHGEKQKPFYLYSRKHGDPEREYNYFALGREYYAQGNGNYRDVNQNRRCDVLFEPNLGAGNIHTFFDLIQTDGYNPLVLTAASYTLPGEKQAAFTKRFPWAKDLLQSAFTPGALAMAAEDAGLSGEENTAFTAEVICAADNQGGAAFQEGYWCDHWTYNLDLIENFLAVFPEKEEELLFDDCRYRYYETQVLVNPRAKRYCMTDQGLRQYHALDETAKVPGACMWMCTSDGQEARSTLIEKLLLLCALKTATLDAAGMGVEMEGGKPGWYDALNGLPGLLGSSMAESCELARLISFTAPALENRDGELPLYSEIAGLVTGAEQILLEAKTPWERWERMNLMKEQYREATMYGYRGEKVQVSCARLAKALRVMGQAVDDGIQRAEEYGGGICPTYFTFTAGQVEETPEGPMPVSLIPHVLPLFLEGPVHWLKQKKPLEQKAAMAKRIQESPLYDPALKMYKVNASLDTVSFEAGRARAFTPGWLENESVWLHMEYKYLLELLKSGLYHPFEEAFHDAAVPFLDPKRYGRSPLENVSFIASSANPDPEVHGRGFVARLSGSTAEFMQMWQIMFFGPRPFRLEDGAFRLAFEPFVPSYLMPKNGVIEAVFLGKVSVTYCAEGIKELIPGETTVVRYHLEGMDGSSQTVEGAWLPEDKALNVRDGKVAAIRVEMQNAKAARSREQL